MYFVVIKDTTTTTTGTIWMQYLLLKRFNDMEQIQSQHG